MKADALLGKVEEELELVKAYGKKFSKKQQALLRDGLARTVGMARHFARLLRRRDYAKLDDFLFSRESLPLGGKEYWFINLVSTKGDKTQLVLTFGCSDAKTRVNRQVAAGGRVAAVGWQYLGKKKVFLEKVVTLETRKGMLWTEEFSFSGAYPSYELAAGKRTRIRFSRPKKGSAYEMGRGSAGAIGAGMLNLYLDAGGVLDGRKFKGASYVQKVVVVAPFIPWNWARVVFPDRSVLDFFVLKLDAYRLGYGLHTSAKYRLPSGREIRLENARLKRLPGDRWLVEADGFAAYMKTYASKPFVLKGRGEFHYDEYLVECADLVFRGIRESGGIGIVEDAYGFMI